MSLQSKYRRFAKNIALTRECEAYKKAREKDDLVTPKVEKAFKDEGYEVDSNFLQGSLAVNTGVIPIDDDYDIDRAIAITRSSSPDNPVEPKKIIKKVLSEHGFKDAKIKKPCVTADYKSEPMHIDFPTYRVGGLFGGYQLAVGKENTDEGNRSWVGFYFLFCSLLSFSNRFERFRWSIVIAIDIPFVTNLFLFQGPIS